LKVASRWVAVLLAAALAHGGSVCASEKEQLRAVRERLEQLQKALAKTERERERAADQLRASEKAISEANLRLRELKQAEREAERALRELSGRMATLERDIERQRQRLAELIRVRYMGGEPSPLKLLLSGREQGETARLLTYQAYVARAQGEFLHRLQTDVEQLGALEAQARARREELAALVAEQQRERAKLDAQRAERRTVLARISGELRAQRKEIEAAKRDEARLARVVEALTKASRDRARAKTPGGGTVARNEHVPQASERNAAFAELKGRLRLPVRGELANRFGTPRPDTGLTAKGLFIRARTGEEVRAVADGEVVYADWMRGFGNLLIVDHGGGYMTIYGHNEAILKRPGDFVRAGEVIATVGATGGNETPGLYFEMRHLGRPFDPLSWVSLK